MYLHDMLSAISPNNRHNPNFTSTMPVVHWVAEANGSYAPALSADLAQNLQSSLVRVLNKKDAPKKWSGFKDVMEAIKDYLGSADVQYEQKRMGEDYKKAVRSFTDYSAEKSNVFKYMNYLITGNDVEVFNERFGKCIGKAKRRAREIFGARHSAETQIALKNYDYLGLNFVNNPARQLYDKDGSRLALHTKFEIMRNKEGRITDYVLKDVRLLPAYGPNSPIVKYNKGKM